MGGAAPWRTQPVAASRARPAGPAPRPPADRAAADARSRSCACARPAGSCPARSRHPAPIPERSAAHAKVGWVSGSGGIPVGKIEQGNLELGHESVNGPKEEGGGSRPKNIGFFAFGADRGLLLNFLTHIRNTS